MSVDSGEQQAESGLRRQELVGGAVGAPDMHLADRVVIVGDGDVGEADLLCLRASAGSCDARGGDTDVCSRLSAYPRCQRLRGGFTDSAFILKRLLGNAELFLEPVV